MIKIQFRSIQLQSNRGFPAAVHIGSCCLITISSSNPRISGAHCYDGSVFHCSYRFVRGRPCNILGINLTQIERIALACSKKCEVIGLENQLCNSRLGGRSSRRFRGGLSGRLSGGFCARFSAGFGRSLRGRICRQGFRQFHTNAALGLHVTTGNGNQSFTGGYSGHSAVLVNLRNRRIVGGESNNICSIGRIQRQFNFGGGAGFHEHQTTVQRKTDAGNLRGQRLSLCAGNSRTGMVRKHGNHKSYNQKGNNSEQQCQKSNDCNHTLFITHRLFFIILHILNFGERHRGRGCRIFFRDGFGSYRLRLYGRELGDSIP